MKITDLSKLISLIEKAPMGDHPLNVTLSDPQPFLAYLAQAVGKRVTLDDFQFLQPWAITALAALGRADQDERIYVENLHETNSAKFAYALGLDDVLSGNEVHGEPEEGRTVKLMSVLRYDQIEPVSHKISELIVSDAKREGDDEYIDADEVRKTIAYVLVELLRNVIQHSFDKSGGIVLAQRMDKGLSYPEPVIQVAVADCGIGILRSLRSTHPDITSPEVALERSILPYYSGTFHTFQTGTSQNAGMGLFFVNEMAKMTLGKMLIASRGASLLIEGDPSGLGNNNIRILPAGFPGTIVAFEVAKRGVADYDELIKRIIQTAVDRRKKAETHRWVKFGVAPKGAIEFVINLAAENTVKAEEFANAELIPRIEARQVLALNFVNVPICTQSFMHALLYKALTRAFALKVDLFITHASESVRDEILFVETYGL